MPRGGRRPNQTGRPRLPEDQKKRTRVVRVPANLDPKALINIADDLRTTLEAYKAQAEQAKANSKTKDYPRTYDKALILLEEIQSLISGLEQPSSPVSEIQANRPTTIEN
jgi:hypothetical protein